MILLSRFPTDHYITDAVYREAGLTFGGALFFGLMLVLSAHEYIKRDNWRTRKEREEIQSERRSL